MNCKDVYTRHQDSIDSQKSIGIFSTKTFYYSCLLVIVRGSQVVSR